MVSGAVGAYLLWVDSAVAPFVLCLIGVGAAVMGVRSGSKVAGAALIVVNSVILGWIVWFAFSLWSGGELSLW